MGRHLWLLMQKKDSFGHGYCHGSHRGGQEENRGCRRERETERERRSENIHILSKSDRKNWKCVEFVSTWN